MNIVRSQPLAIIASFPEPILPGAGGAAVVPGSVNAGPIVPAYFSDGPDVLGTRPAAAAARIGGDLAWWLVQNQHPKKGAAIPVLDAVFAHYGPSRAAS